MHDHRALLHQLLQRVVLVARDLEAAAGAVDLIGLGPEAVVTHHVGMIGAVVGRGVNHRSHRAMLEHSLADDVGGVSISQRNFALYVLAGVVGILGAGAYIHQLALPVAAFGVGGNAHGHIAEAAQADRREILRSGV